MPLVIDHREREKRSKKTERPFLQTEAKSKMFLFSRKQHLVRATTKKGVGQFYFAPTAAVVVVSL